MAIKSGIIREILWNAAGDEAVLRIELPDGSQKLKLATEVQLMPVKKKQKAIN